ncbi:MAG: copper resistance protein B [Candidatus Binatia bacterium]
MLIQPIDYFLIVWFALAAASTAAPCTILAQQQKVVPPPPKEWPAPVMDDQVIGYLLFDQLEYRVNDGPDTFTWEVQGWVGRDYDKLWVKTEGDQRLSGDNGGDPEVQLLYSHLITPFFYFQVGGRYDQLYGAGPDRSRFFGVISLQGLAPYQFDIEPALFISEDGDVSARLEAEYDLLFTQRLILQPRLEVEVAGQEVRKFGVGEGFNDVELGLRLRYEIRREFAPYIGVSWTRLLGNTADFARREGDEVDNLTFVVGVRIWF